ncbi:hypothetical protein GCM10007338_07300 [Corynebacterium pelargi]|nr:hypothetical protein GCM10007338_07300 [Corynebacterium pelargi]
MVSHSRTDVAKLNDVFFGQSHARNAKRGKDGEVIANVGASGCSPKGSTGATYKEQIWHIPAQVKWPSPKI